MNRETTDHSPLFSIFIPTWNNLPMLRLCVESNEKNSTYPHEIIIHVNDGSDGTLDWVRSRGLKHTHSAENIGICWAMNGMRPLATTDYIAFVNDDMYLLPGWDEALYSRIREEDGDLWFMASTVIQRVGHSRRPRAIQVADYGTDASNFREEQLLDEYRRYEQTDWRGAVQPPCVVSRNALARRMPHLPRSGHEPLLPFHEQVSAPRGEKQRHTAIPSQIRRDGASVSGEDPAHRRTLGFGIRPRLRRAAHRARPRPPEKFIYHIQALSHRIGVGQLFPQDQK